MPSSRKSDRARRRHWLLLPVAFFLVIGHSATASRAEVTYTYTGSTYAAAAAPYTIADRLTGTFVLPLPLPGSMPLTDVSDALMSFSFDDGVHTRDASNSVVCGFVLQTNAAGAIIGWDIHLRENWPGAGFDQNAMQAHPLGDDVGVGPAAAAPCDPIVLSSGSGMNAAPGSFGGGAPIAPTEYTYTGALFDSASGPYNIGDSVNGTVTFSDMVPALLDGKDIAYALVDFTLADGVQTRVPANSFACGFTLTTGASAEFVAWSAFFRESPHPPLNDPQQTLDISTGGDLGGALPSEADPCGDALGLFAGQSSEGGTWTGPFPDPNPTSYSYSGALFPSPEGPYGPGDRVSGQITLSGPLPPLLPLTEIGGALTELFFFDGVEPRRLNDSTICSFAVATDAAGDIVEWSVVLRETVGMQGQTQNSIDTQSTGPPFDVAGSAPRGTTQCSSLSLSPGVNSFNQGSWRLATGVLSIPSLSSAGLVAFALLLALVAGVFLRRT